MAIHIRRRAFIWRLAAQRAACPLSGSLLERDSLKLTLPLCEGGHEIGAGTLA
jgi:hypothetical protein